MPNELNLHQQTVNCHCQPGHFAPSTSVRWLPTSWTPCLFWIMQSLRWTTDVIFSGVDSLQSLPLDQFTTFSAFWLRTCQMQTTGTRAQGWGLCSCALMVSKQNTHIPIYYIYRLSMYQNDESYESMSLLPIVSLTCCISGNCSKSLRGRLSSFACLWLVLF